MPDDVSPIAVEFAKRIAPKLAIEVESRKAKIIADSGGFFQQQAVAMAFPVGLHLIPRITEAGADAMLDEFGGMTLQELASRVISHQQAKGRAVHASYHRHD